MPNSLLNEALKYSQGGGVMIYKSCTRVMALIATLIFFSHPVVAAAIAGEGTLNFGGRLVSQTCTIAVNNSTSVAPLVQLPRVSRKGMSVEGETKGGTRFTFKFSECSSSLVTKARVYFQSGSSVSESGTLENKLTSHAATGVALQLYDASMNPIRVGDPSQLNQTAMPLADLMEYYVRYIAESDAIGSGPFQTSVTYSISYE